MTILAKYELAKESDQSGHPLFKLVSAHCLFMQAEYSDLTVQVSSLIRVFTRLACHGVDFVMY